MKRLKQVMLITLVAATVASFSAFAQDAAKPLTNADVIKMVEAGVPKSAIVASIRSGSGALDLSNEARAALFAAGGKNRVNEMTEIWDAMIAKATNGRGGDDADELSPQPHPANRKTNALGIEGEAGASHAGVRNPRLTANPNFNIKLGSPKSGPRVANPRAVKANAAVIAVLQQQRRVADSESAQMNLGNHSQTQAILPAGSSAVVGGSAVNGGGGAINGASASNGRSATSGGSARNTTSAAAVTMQRSPSAGTSGPEKTAGETGIAVGSRVATRTLLDTTALTCAHDPTFRILNVGGSSFPATFTPIDQYNLYTIAGCSFGGQSGRAYIYGTGTFQGNFIVKFWSDNSIALSLDPALSGVPDLDNLTLVIKRADGQEVQKGGFKFYAARGDALGNAVLLKLIPAGQTQLHPSPWMDIQYSSPISDPSDAAGMVSRNFRIEIDRTTSNATINGQNGFHVNGNNLFLSYPYDPQYNAYNVQDSFDTGHLAQGFSSVSAALDFWVPDASALCGAGDDVMKSYTDDPVHSDTGSPPWGLSWDGDTVHVAGPLYKCYDLEVFKENLVAQSRYAVKVWVIGPRCLDPWTGHPDTQCVAEVKKQFGE